MLIFHDQTSTVTQTREITPSTSCFLHPPNDSHGKEHGCLYDDSPMPAPGELCNVAVYI